MTITAEEIYLLNKMNSTASKVQLGTLIANAEAIVASEIALANGKVLIGNASGVAAACTLSGDVTTTNAGVTAIGAAKVTKAMLAATVRPENNVIACEDAFTTVGGNAAEVVTEANVLVGDKVSWSIIKAGATPRTGVSAVAGAGNITFTFSGDPANDHIISYIVVRATT